MRRGALRPLLTGTFVIVVLAAAGVAAAAMLRHGPNPSPAKYERAVAPAISERQSTIPLDDLPPPRRTRGGESREATGPPAQATEVIGVGTGEFSGGTGDEVASTVPGVEDVDGPADPGEAELASDAEIRSELADFRDHLDGVDPRKGARAYIDKNGRAVLPKGAPRSVARVVAAANEIATKPYKWGGGHGAWKDSGYDCSGSVSFALAGARLLDSPLASGPFMRYGDAGPGRWISTYSNPGHMFMTVAGLRFDTSGRDSAGTRWQRGTRSTAGFTVRHPPGL